MRGSVIKRGSSWCVVIDAGRDAEGRRVRKWHSGFATRKEAERARTEILSRLDRGTYVEPDRRTLGAFLEQEWLPAIQARLRPSTLDSYAHDKCAAGPEAVHQVIDDLMRKGQINRSVAKKLHSAVDGWYDSA